MSSFIPILQIMRYCNEGELPGQNKDQDRSSGEPAPVRQLFVEHLRRARNFSLQGKEKTEMCLPFSPGNASFFQLLQRCFSCMPVSLAIRSNSAGQT
jgi:hypothetical protein